jgi:hypothetical protein
MVTIVSLAKCNEGAGRSGAASNQRRRFSETLFTWMMRFRKLLLLAALCPPLQPFQPASNAVAPAGPLPSSETLDYSIEWRLITAGKTRIRFAANPAGFSTSVHMESAGLVSKLFKVEDEYSSDLERSLCARSSLFKTHEGSRQRETRISFDQERKKASYLERDTARNAVLASHEIDTPGCVTDIVGALYRMRTLNLDPGQSAKVAISDGKKSALARVDSQRLETVKTPAGAFRTVRYEAFLFDNVIYRRSGRVFIWLTDDSRRVPVQIQVRLQLAIGTITLQLEKEGI